MFPFAELTDDEFMALFPVNYQIDQNGHVFYRGVWYPYELDYYDEWADEDYDTTLIE